MITEITDEIIFTIEGVLFLILALTIKVFYDRKTPITERKAPRNDLNKIDVGITSIKARYAKQYHSKIFGSRPDPTTINQFRQPLNVLITEKNIPNKLWKAFFLTALVILFLSGYLAGVPLTQHYGSWVFLWVILFIAYIGGLLGFLHIIRAPRISASQIFDVYINLGALLFGIPFSFFFIFIIVSMILLIFVSPSGDPQTVVVATFLVIIFAILVTQGYFIISTMKKHANEHDLTVIEYIKFKMSGEERDRIQREQLIRKKRIDSLYERIPEIKRHMHPGMVNVQETFATLKTEDYCSVEKKRIIHTILTEFGPAILGIIAANIFLIMVFMFLASYGGF